MYNIIPGKHKKFQPFLQYNIMEIKLNERYTY